MTSTLYCQLTDAERQAERFTGFHVSIFPIHGLRVAQRSKVLHRSVSAVTTDPGLILGCVAAGRDREIHEEAHNWPSVIQVRGGFGRPGCPCPITL